MSASKDLSDTDRLDYLSRYPDILEDVRGRVNNEGVTVRDAIDWFITELKRWQEEKARK